jgi:hypothetical protein
MESEGDVYYVRSVHPLDKSRLLCYNWGAMIDTGLYILDKEHTNILISSDSPDIHPKLPKQRLTKSLYVRLSPDEHRALKKRATRLGVKVSTLARMVLKLYLSQRGERV